MGADERGRSWVFRLVLGLAVGSLTTGLLLPFVVGDPVPDTSLAVGDTASASASEDLGAGETPGDGATTLDTTTDGAPGSSTTTTAPAAGAPGAAPAGGAAASSLQATDVGVTATTIKLGVVLLDLATARSVGLAPDNYTVEDQRRAYEVFIRRINEAGGVHGRKVEAAYAVADPFDNATAEAACLKLTRDDKVFAVLSVAGFRGTASLCITRDNRTPLIAQGHHPQEYFRASRGLLITDMSTSERTATMFITTLKRLGVLKGKTIGVVTNRDATNGEKQGGDAVMAALRAQGFEVARRADLSEDLPTGASQIPVEVQRMRAAGVDAVVLATNFLYSTQWAQAADGQGWRPAYFAGQIGDMTSDDLAKNMPPGYDGAIAVTSGRYTHDARAKRPEPPVDRDCREHYNAATGLKYPYGGTNPVMAACAGMRLFQAIATAAGPTLTRATYVGAAQRVGTFAWPGMLGGSLGPGKFDYVDEARPLRWQAGCRCYHIAGEAQRAG